MWRVVQSRISQRLAALDRLVERAVLHRFAPRQQRLLNASLLMTLLAGLVVGGVWPCSAGLCLTFPLMAVCFFRGPRAGWLLLPMLVYEHFLLGEAAQDVIFTAAALAGILLSAMSTHKYRQARYHELRLEADLELARQVQTALHPCPLLRSDGLEVATHLVTSSRLGGDFLCLSAPGPGRTGLLLGDVMGKGTQAALSAALLDGAYAELAREGLRPGPVLTQLNQCLVDRFGSSTRMATMVCLEVDWTDKVWRVARAGHPPPLLVRGDGHWLELDVPGMMAGVLEHEQYQERHYPLLEEDQALLVTDGLVQGSLQDCPDVVARSHEWSRAPSDRALVLLVQLMRGHLRRPPLDDETAVLLRILEPGK